MKTCTATLHDPKQLQTVAKRKMLALLKISLREVAGLAIAVLAAAGIITLSAWLAAADGSPILAAATWALGFIYLASALDSHGPAALSRAATGMALPVLAMMQDRVSADFLIVAGVLLAAWTAWALARLLAVQKT